MYINCRSQNFYTFELYGHMYCYYNVLPARGYCCCLLVNNIVYIKFFSGNLPAMNICLHAKFQVRWCYGFNKIKRKKEKRKCQRT